MTCTSTLLSVSVGHGKCCFLSNVLNIQFANLKSLGPNPRLLLGWSKRPEKCPGTRVAIALDALHPYIVTPALLRKSTPWRGSSARAFRFPLPEPQLQNVLERRGAGRGSELSREFTGDPRAPARAEEFPGGKIGKGRTHPNNTGAGAGARRPALEDEGASRQRRTEVRSRVCRRHGARSVLAGGAGLRPTGGT